MKKQTTLYVVRHGTTDLNQRYCFQGWIDEPLNDLGIKQGSYLYKRLYFAGASSAFGGGASNQADPQTDRRSGVLSVKISKSIMGALGINGTASGSGRSLYYVLSCR